MQFIRWASLCLLHDQLTMLLSCASFDTLRAFFSTVSTSLLNLRLFWEPTLMPIGQGILLIADPLLVITFSLAPLWSLGEARNSLLWLALIQRLNIVPLLIPHLNSSGCDGYYRIYVCPLLLLLLSIVTIEVLFRLFTMMSSTSKPNTSRSIVILSGITFFRGPSSWSLFPLTIK